MEDFAPAQELMRRAGLPRGRRALDFLRRASAVPTAGAWAAMTDSDRDRGAADVRALLKESPAWLRTRLTLALADAEAASGKDLLAAAYRFRALRWLGDDRFGVTPSITATATSASLNEEAMAVAFCRQSLGSDADQPGVSAYLQSRYEALRRIAIPADYEQRTDARSKDRYRVSVIVSMYNVTPQALDRFMQMLSTLTMVKRGDAEVIFIDSGSPWPQWALLSSRVDSLKALGMEYVFVRTAARETIQSAWNRGITLARGEYLACLGTDEALHPQALDVLADTLDRQPSVDWAMSDSVVTSVDARGVHVDDKMAYLRTGNWSEASLLFDCTYLSYVGGLYRRSVHDRFGYYDPTFSGAGDTEFKCRVHPFITTVHVPRTLGAFLDYPAERVTASYRIELEDARAWYLFRTPGGIRYLFQNADASRIEAAFWGMLANRRAFTGGPESDVQFAVRLLPLLRERNPQSPALAHEPAVRQLLATARALGWQSDWSIEGFRRTAARLQTAESTFADLARSCPEPRAFPSSMTSDSQFFAHAWIWE
jgi:glycosyltransferase involved in cell wall biosynthesis